MAYLTVVLEMEVAKMSWLQVLAKTYDNNLIEIGNSATNRPLLPICHTTVQTHIEITLDRDGNFRRVQIVGKDDNTTIIPCTEVSSSRSGKRPPSHPYSDKLQYIVRDFIDYGGVVTSGFADKPKEPYENYVAELESWCNSRFTHSKVRAVLQYVKKGTMMADLVANHILLVDSNGKLLDKKEVNREKNAIDIFSVVNGEQFDAVVRWVIEIPGETESKAWRDRTLWDSWTNYYLSKRRGDGLALCMVSGEESIPTKSHPKYIRREGDGAKLISANDTSGFTFRGRFEEAEQACGVGLEVSQKAHFALQWLISRQGYTKDDLAIVAWAPSGIPVPQPTDDTYSLFEDAELPEEESAGDTAQDLGLRLKKRIAGYGRELGPTSNVIVMAVDSATTGRLAITFYRELTGSDFIARINNWHSTCAWHHTYKQVFMEVDGKRKPKPVKFTGAPAPNDIAEAAYGSRLDDKLRKATIARLLPCVVDGMPIPPDLVEATFRRASNRVGLDYWDWNKTLTIACALYRKHTIKTEEHQMTLDPNRKTRDYLYGRLLALAESLEEWALNEAGEKRTTNAARLMQRFAEHPHSTWRTIELALIPYKTRLGGKATKRLRLIDEVVAAFEPPDDFLRDTRLSGEFLLGYHCQREALRSSTTNTDIAQQDTDISTNEE